MERLTQNPAKTPGNHKLDWEPSLSDPVLDTIGGMRYCVTDLVLRPSQRRQQ